MLRVHDKRTFILYLILAAVAVGAANFISRDLFFRLDITDNGIYSLSESSKKVVEKIEDRLTMKVYFSDNLPGEYGNNRRYLQDILEEYEAYAHGNVHFEIYPPESDETLAMEAQRYGIQPVQLQVIENDKLEVKRVYMGLVLLYGDKRETLPIIQTTTGLEYEITTQIKKLVERERRTVGVAKFADQEVKMDNARQVLGQTYNVRMINLDREVPPEIPVLLLSGAQDSVSTDELAHLRGFVGRGGNLFFAQGRIKADLSTQMGTPIQSNIFEVVDALGANLEENLVLDGQCGNVTVTQSRGIFRMNSQVPYPFFPAVRRFGDHVMVKGLEQVQVLYASEISLDAGADTLAGGTGAGAPTSIPLLMTSDRSGEMTGFYNLRPMDNPLFGSLNQPGKTVAALLTVPADSVGAVSQVVLVGDTEFLSDSGGGTIPENFVFIANAVDYLMGDSDLVELRSREVTSRPLLVLSDAARSKWKWANIVLPTILVIGYGVVRWRREVNRAKILEERYG